MKRQPAQQADLAILNAKVQDAIRFSSLKGRTHFIGFLDEKEADQARMIAARCGCDNYCLWGGHEAAERLVMCVYPESMQPELKEYPIKVVTISYRPCDTLTHRDFLGSLMALGINRDTIGDILVEEGRCVIFIRQEISSYLLLQITKIGRTGVKLKDGVEEPLPAGRGYRVFSTVIASARLDCAVAAAVNISREKAVSLITSGQVQLNHQEIITVSVLIKQGDKLSIRGKGRFILDQVGPETKKGRLALTGRKYI